MKFQYSGSGGRKIASLKLAWVTYWVLALGATQEECVSGKKKLENQQTDSNNCLCNLVDG